MNITTITDAAIAFRVCVKQRIDTEEQMRSFLTAYMQAKTTNTKDFDEKRMEEFIKFLARIIEPEANRIGYRTQDTNLNGDGEQISGEKLQRTMESFYTAFIKANLTPEELYLEILQIAPFQDGNGRISDLIWRMAYRRTKGRWPGHSHPNK